jgi:VCBS repeat-containing protein
MTYRSLRLLALVALLAVLPFGAGQQVAAQTSPPRFILCAPAAAVAGIAQRHGLTVVRPVDQHAHDVFLVTGPTGVATPDLLSIVRSDTAVINFEPDTTRTLTETGFGLNQSTVAILDQSTVAILDALTDRTLSPFGDADVWNAYINQPAATIIKLPEAHERFGTGTGVIALIDEGVDPNHGLLVPALVPGYDFLRNLPGIASEWLDLNQKLISQLTQSTVAILDQSTVAILDGSSPAVLNQSTVAILDQSTVAILDTTQVPASFGHGTMMAGVIRRVAPGANIMPLKAFKADGTANLFDVIRAIYYAVDNGARVIVMGFSMPETSVELAHAINFATSKGVTAVAAAGNDGRETIVFPAALRNVVGVGSTTYTDQRSVFSNFGDSLVKVAAPGEAIITSYPGLRYAAASGTSFSAALVGGAVALMQQAAPALSPAGVSDGIGKGAPAATSTLKLGAGRLNVLEALNALAGPETDPLPAPAPNQAPAAVNDMVTVAEDTSLVIDVRANDVDADGDALTVLAVTTPTHGTAVLGTAEADSGRVTYTPAANFTGVDGFTYTITDGRATATAAVTVTVTGRNDIPVATADAAETQEDIPVVIDVLANDTDGDGEALTVASTTGATRGTVTIEAAGPDAGRVRYVPNANAIGVDTFTYSIRDTRNGTATATVTVTISAVNDAPLAANDAVTTPADSAIVIDAAANDSDHDGNALAVTSVTQPTHGAVTVVTEGVDAGRINYTPSANFSGTDSFAYTIDDGNGGSATGIVTVTVTSVNDVPSAAADAATGAEDTSLVIDVTANDTDIDGDRLAVSAVTQGANGAVSVAAEGADAGKVVYMPAANFSGTDTFTYTLADGNGATASAVVSVTVATVNDAPAAADDAATILEDGVAVIAVTANDADVENDPVAVTSVTQPANGTAVVVTEGADAGSVSYRPAANFAGTDAFSYSIADGNGGTATATVTVTITSVNDVPVAADDAATGPEDAVLVIDVVANDTDADRERVNVVSITQAAHGTVTILAEGGLRYSPSANFAGSDQFTYTIADGTSETSTATVTVTITALNDHPIAVDDAATTSEDNSVAVEPLANDTDAEAEGLTITAVSTPAHGTATLQGAQVTYAPAANFAGADSFTYTVADGSGGTATGTVSVTVSSVEDAPVAADDAASGAEDAAIVIEVLANDTDPDGAGLKVANVTEPASGTVTITAGGAISYRPAPNFAGADRFTYTVTDGTGESAPATVSVTVSAVNDQPVAGDDSATTAEDTPVSIPVNANDADPDGDVLVLAVGSAPAHGTVAIAAGQVTYMPAANFAGIDSFTYTVADGNGGNATATVAVTVTAVDDAPVAVDDAATGAEDTAIVVDVLANDSDADATSVKVANVTQPANGTVTVTAAGTISYSPALNFAGTDRFTYSVTDGAAESAPATVVVTVSPANDLPIAGADATATSEDTPVVIRALANDQDTDGDALGIVAVGAPAFGSAVVIASGPEAGQIAYTPNADFAGSDRFTYTVSDGNGGQATAAIEVTVAPANDPPSAADDAFTVAAEGPAVIDVLVNDSAGPDAGDTLSLLSLGGTASGTVTLSGSTVVYTPPAGFTGTDSFIYTVGDSHGATATATVIVTVVVR